MSNSGVSVNDFTQILTDFSRTLSYEVSTKTTNQLTGDETQTFAAASNKSLIFFKEENRFLFDKEGLVEVGDAYIMAATTTGIKRYDKFTIDGETFYVHNVIPRRMVGTYMLDYGVCMLVTS